MDFQQSLREKVHAYKLEVGKIDRIKLDKEMEAFRKCSASYLEMVNKLDEKTVKKDMEDKASKGETRLKILFHPHSHQNDMWPKIGHHIYAHVHPQLIRNPVPDDDCNCYKFLFGGRSTYPQIWDERNKFKEKVKEVTKNKFGIDGNMTRETIEESDYDIYHPALVFEWND